MPGRQRTAEDEDILELAAKDGSMINSQWSALLEGILPRLDHIVHYEFPIPSIPFHAPLSRSVSNEVGDLNLDPPSTPPLSSQQSQKENIVPSSLDAPEAGTPVGSASSPTSQLMVPDSQPASISVPSDTLPPQLSTLFSSIQKTLKTQFFDSPPYTVQRFAELVLRPSDHYRTLPSYLRALDRVLSVSSTADAFPLPSIATNIASENGEANAYLAAGAPPTVNQDEFNGAALTRIPWLRDSHPMLMNSDRPLSGDLRTESTSLIDGPNGAGSLETVTVSVNGLARTAQRDPLALVHTQPEVVQSVIEAGAGQSSRMTRSNTALTVAGKAEEADEGMVHARGPDEIGVEDMGPQTSNSMSRGFDVEAALGRPGEGEDTKGTSLGGEKEENDADGDDEVGYMDQKEAVQGGEASIRKEGNEQQNLVDTSAL
ncbi:hypothetical protein MMC13_008209 [Lambiella insularis]|nr:hypothetical protein [Lambiella insularis]